MSKTTRNRAKENADLLIVNANELLTLALAEGNLKPHVGKQMRELGIIRDGAIAIRNGKIVAIGETREITKAFRGEHVISATGKTVMPGFIDPHTHLIFAGSREDEFQMRVEGASYMEILGSGDGIFKTVKETRRTRIEKLVDLGLERLDAMLICGTTTIEAKSGYGLKVEDELKILEAARRLNQLHCVTVVSTFFGANAVPLEYKGSPEEYVALISDIMIPRIAQTRLAEFCDVFCERGAFSLEQAKRILLKAKNHGLKPKIHADEISLRGGAEIAADIGATSADHLTFSSVEGIKAMARKGVIAVLLPVASLGLMMGKHADARLMIDSGVPVALGTDFNACYMIENQQLVIALACYLMRMTPAEAITAATINAAHAIGRANEVGSLELGKKADIIILDIPSHRFLGYRFGANLVNKVIKNGRVAVDREEQDEPIFMNKTE